MKRRNLIYRIIPAITLLLLLALAGCTVANRPAAPRQFTILAINDVYRIEGLNDGRKGGLARVRALRRMLEEESLAVLFLHAGDFLYPSLLSDRYDGEQMVDLLNLMDGDPKRFDERMFVTFGNHEFDKGRLRDAERLDGRIEQSQFDWLGSNIVFEKDQSGAPTVRSENLLEHRIVDIGGVKVGLFSLTTDMVQPAYVTSFEPPLTVAQRLSRRLRDQGAEVVVALTHLKVTEDEAILRRLGSDGPDLIIGGHEHHQIKRCVSVGDAVRCILKADADAVTATVARIEIDETGPVLSSSRFHPLSDRVVPDPVVAARVSYWLDRYADEYCGQAGPDCLEQIIGWTAVELVAEEHRIRQYETNVGDWAADEMLRGFNRFEQRGEAAKIAFINSGALRFNQNIPPGKITERELKELLPYPVELLKMELSGRRLKQVLEHAADAWPGSGSWLQISGFTFRHRPDNPAGKRITDLRFSQDNGGGVIADDDRFLAVTSRFLRGGGDGYAMLMQIPDSRVALPSTPIELKDILRKTLRDAGRQGIAPQCDGRIRSPANPCLRENRRTPG